MRHEEPYFKVFESALKGERGRLIGDDKKDTKSFLEQQRRDVEELMQLERDFKAALQSHPLGAGVYHDFLLYVCVQRHNILDARPYFRERQKVFNEEISDLLRVGDFKALYRFDVNYRFIKFALEARKWHPNARVRKLAARHAEVRTKLATLNMPLAINRARIFFSRTPRSHLTHMDLVQIAAEALLAGIDKYVGVYSRAFRGVAIGRMTGNFIEAYSETLLHFWPKDKRKLYRANKLVGRQAPGSVDFDDLSDKVNLGGDPIHQTTAGELAALMAAASTVSTSPQDPEQDGEESREDKFQAPESTRPDVRVEAAQAAEELRRAAPCCLTNLELKILRLKGIDLDSLYSRA